MFKVKQNKTKKSLFSKLLIGKLAIKEKDLSICPAFPLVTVFLVSKRFSCKENFS